MQSGLEWKMQWKRGCVREFEGGRIAISHHVCKPRAQEGLPWINTQEGKNRSIRENRTRSFIYPPPVSNFANYMLHVQMLKLYSKEKVGRRTWKIFVSQQFLSVNWLELVRKVKLINKLLCQISAYQPAIEGSTNNSKFTFF